MDDLIQKILEKLVGEAKQTTVEDKIDETLNDLIRARDKISLYEFIRDRRLQDLKSQPSAAFFPGGSRNINEEVIVGIANMCINDMKERQEKLYRDFVALNEAKILEFAKEHRRNCSDESCRNGNTPPGRN